MKLPWRRKKKTTGKETQEKGKEVSAMADFEGLKKRTEELLKKAAPAGTGTLAERTAPVLVAKDEELRKREGAVAAKETELGLREKACLTRETTLQASTENLEKAQKAIEGREAAVKEAEAAVKGREEAATKKEAELNDRATKLDAQSKELDGRGKILDEVATNQAQIDEALVVRETQVKSQEAEVVEVRALAGVIQKIIEEMNLRPELEARGIWPDFAKYVEKGGE